MISYKANYKDVTTVDFNKTKDALLIIDQTKIPNELVMLELDTPEEVYEAIKNLRVRGAPAIGDSAAIGIAVIANKFNCQNDHYDEFLSEFTKVKNYLASSRPTAVNLFWALDCMAEVVKNNSDKTVPEIKAALIKKAEQIRTDDIEMSRAIGEHGLALFKDGDGILTHCNAGELATVKYGTALAPIHLGREKGYNFKVYSDETRPLLQGARLTAFELFEDGIDVTVMCDNMASRAMKEGKINAVIVGADRIAANGDVCNKIGTSGVAILAKHYGIPFYVAAPTSTIDMATASGNDIPIEERNPDEVTEMHYVKRMAPVGVNVYNPAFDVTDAELVTGIITELGVAYPPYSKSLSEIMKKKTEQ